MSTREEQLLYWKNRWRQISSGGGTRFDKEGWITVNGTHIHMTEEGTVDKGPSGLKKAIGGSKSKSKGGKSSGGASSAKNTTAKRSTPALVNNPTSPAKINSKKCNKARDAGLSNCGGSVFETNTNDNETWEFEGRVSKATVAVNLANALREAGYETVFWTPSGKQSEKPTNNISVRDPKNSWRSIDYYISDSENSASGKTYYDITTEEVY